MAERSGGLSNGYRKAEESARSGPVKGWDGVPRSVEIASAKVLGRESAPLLKAGLFSVREVGGEQMTGTQP